MGLDPRRGRSDAARPDAPVGAGPGPCPQDAPVGAELVSARSSDGGTYTQSQHQLKLWGLIVSGIGLAGAVGAAIYVAIFPPYPLALIDRVTHSPLQNPLDYNAPFYLASAFLFCVAFVLVYFYRAWAGKPFSQTPALWAGLLVITNVAVPISLPLSLYAPLAHLAGLYYREPGPVIKLLLVAYAVALSILASVAIVVLSCGR